MSIITDQTYTSDSIQNQLNAANCIGTFGCPQPYYPQPVYYDAAVRSITVEAVDDGGFIITGYYGKERKRVVAASSAAAAEVLRGWAAQYECKAK